MLVAPANCARRIGPTLLCAVALVAITSSGCQTVEKMAAPSLHRNWQPQYAVLPTAEFRGSEVTVRNVRYCKYLSKDTFVPDWYDRQFNIEDIRAVDFVVMPFSAVEALAHTQVSFEIAPPGEKPQYLVVSAEVRKEVGEDYGPIKGGTRQFELTYVVADERDSILSQTNIRNADVYVYRSTASPEQAQRLFVDMMSRANGLATQPEFYDTLTNNCTTNIADHINRVHPRRLSYDVRSMLPGLSDKVAYEQGLIVHHGSFAETKSRAHVNPRAARYDGRGDFSALIRR